MSEFLGTPGPWVVSFHGPDNCWVVDSENDSAIAKVTRYKGEGSVQKANFQLIVSAPELLEALQEVIAAMKITLRVGHERIIELGGQCDSPEMMIKGHSEIARAELVIAKALGK